MKKQCMKYGMMIIAAVLLVALAFAGTASADTWDGKSVDHTWYTGQSSPYIINNASQFASFAQIVNNGESFINKEVKLGADIDLGDHQWEPIGRVAGVMLPQIHLFEGTFDGQNHIIKNLNITVATPAILFIKTDAIGLFSTIGQNAKIVNLNIDGVQILREGAGNGVIGSLVGYVLAGGEITNCHVTNLKLIYSKTLSIKYSVGIGGTWVGGLIGDSNGPVSNCSVQYVPNGIVPNNIYVISPDLLTPVARDIGGLIGMAHASVRNCSSVGGSVLGQECVGGLIGRTQSGCEYVTDCYSDNEVTGKRYLGGLIGRVHPSSGDTMIIKNCSASGYVHSEQKDSEAIGGLIGHVGPAEFVTPKEVTIKNCYATGNVSGTQRVGGLIGDAILAADRSIIASCHAEGDVYLFESSSLESGKYIGGLIGWSDSPVAECYATGNVRGLSKVGGLIGSSEGNECLSPVYRSYATGNVTGGECVGGLAGYTDDNVMGCYATGRVEGKSEVGGLIGEADHNNYVWKVVRECNASGMVMGSGDNVGGLIGRNYNNIDYCYATGLVKSGGDYVGGLIGKSSASASIEFYDCYATGDVICSGSDHVGGLAGYVDDRITRCNASGNVKIYYGDGSYVGGLIGEARKSITYCNASGDVTVSNMGRDTEKYVGGLVGYVYGRDCEHAGICIEDSYATGNVTISKGKYVGGLAGYADEEVTKSYASGRADVSESGEYVGGLIGYSNDPVTYSYATGNVTASPAKYVGGLTGYNNYEITSCFATGKVIGKEKVGGLSGEADRPISNSAALNPSVSGNTYVGKVCGDPDGEKITGCTIWSGMTKSGSGGKGSDTGKEYSSTTIWATFPGGMWGTLDGLGKTGANTIWVENDGTLNPWFELPTVMVLFPDITSDARHLKPTTIYTVTFDVQGHGSVPASQKVMYGEKVVKPADPVDSDYEFNGWFKESGCTNEWDFENDTVTHDTTIYAKWIETEKQVVVFDVQGHGTAPDPQYVVTGRTATMPSPDPSESGWTFKGWYKESGCTTEWNFSTPITHDTTIYAKWLQNNIMVAFDVQGYGTAPDPQYVASGEKVEEPKDPEDEKATFGGWYKEPGCSNEWDFNTDTVTQDTIIYAKWTPLNKVTFDVQGHGIAPESQYIENGEKVTEPEDPVSERYEFGGWFREPGCSNAWNFNSDTVSTDTTLYAKWTMQYIVAFIDLECDVEVEPQLVTGGDTATEPSPEPQEEHHIFNGWFKDVNCTEKWNFNTPVMKDMILFANWTPLNYTVTFDGKGGSPVPPAESHAYGDHIKEPAEPTKSGYLFEGWCCNVTGIQWDFAGNTVERDMTLEAMWINESKAKEEGYHNITLTMDNCIAFMPVKHAPEGVPIIITIYTFPGFSDPTITAEPTQSSLTPPFKAEYIWVSTFIMPDNDVHIHVNSSLNLPHLITLSQTGKGEFLAIKPISYKGDKVVFTLLPGYQYTVKNNTINATYNSETKQIKVYGFDAILMGLFTMPDYNVQAHVDFIQNKFSVNATSGGHGEISPDRDSGFSGDNVTFSLTPDDGYEIANLTLNGVDKTSEIIKDGDDGTYTCTIVDRDLTAHANFKQDVRKYNITNVTNGNGTLKTDKFKAYGDEVITAGLQAGEGYVFKNATYVNNTGVIKELEIYPGDDSYIGKFVMPHNDTVVTGNFEPKVINVTFNVNGGNISTLNPTSKDVTFGQAYGTLPSPKRDVFTFKGWYRNIEGLGDEVNASTIVTTPGNHTLYAQWEYAIIITNYRINFGTQYEGDTVSTIADGIYTTIDPSSYPLYMDFPTGTSFNFTNSTTHEVLSGKKKIPKDADYWFNVTPKDNLAAGYYSANINLSYGTSYQYFGSIPVTYSVLSAAAKGDPEVSVPELPTIYKLAMSAENGLLDYIGIEGAENLNISGTSADIFLNGTAAENMTTIHVTNINGPSANGFNLTRDSEITALYPAKELGSGGTYKAELGLTDVSANLPSLTGEFNSSLASAVSSATGSSPLAMVSTMNPDSALDSMNKLIIADGIKISFTVAKSQISDTSRLAAYHVDGSGVTQVYRDIADAGSNYIVNVTGSSFSGYVLGMASSPVPQPPSGGGGRNYGGSMLMPNDGSTSSTMCTVNFSMNGHGTQVINQTVSSGNTVDEPYPAPTADGYVFNGWYLDRGLTTKYVFSTPVTDNIVLYASWSSAAGQQTSSTSKSPAPFAGIIAGFGIVALVLNRMRR